MRETVAVCLGVRQDGSAAIVRQVSSLSACACMDVFVWYRISLGHHSTMNVCCDTFIVIISDRVAKMWVSR